MRSLTIHVLDVVDRTVSFMEFNQDYELDDDEDVTRSQDYSRYCFRGLLDRTGMSSTPYSGGHAFGGPGGPGIAGEWGGNLVHGLFPPAGGIAPLGVALECS